MPVYEYKGFTSAGAKTGGMIDAENIRAARVKLKRLAVYPTDLKEKSERKFSLGMEISLRRGQGRVKIEDIAAMTRQLATLLHAGIPLVTSLNGVIDQVHNDTLKATLTDIRERVKEGASVGDALAAHPGIFSQAYANMVRAGESSGTLDEVLGRLASFLDSQVMLRSKVRAALIYPAVMVVVAIGVVTFMLVYVIPKITMMLEQSGATLPLMTRILIALTNVLMGYWWLLLVLVVGGIYGAYRGLETDRGRELFDAWLLRVPVVGSLVQMIAVSRFTRTLATLLSGGVPLVRALDIVQPIVSNVVMERSIAHARDVISEGGALATPLQQSGLFPPIVVQMIAAGEQSGELETMLTNVADTYDSEVDTNIAALTSVFEPAMIIIMAAVIGFIVLSVLLPILNLTQGLG